MLGRRDPMNDARHTRDLWRATAQRRVSTVIGLIAVVGLLAGTVRAASATSAGTLEGLGTPTIQTVPGYCNQGGNSYKTSSGGVTLVMAGQTYSQGFQTTSDNECGGYGPAGVDALTWSLAGRVRYVERSGGARHDQFGRGDTCISVVFTRDVRSQRCTRSVDLPHGHGRSFDRLVVQRRRPFRPVHQLDVGSAHECKCQCRGSPIPNDRSRAAHSTRWVSCDD